MDSVVWTLSNAGQECKMIPKIKISMLAFPISIVRINQNFKKHKEMVKRFNWFWVQISIWNITFPLQTWQSQLWLKPNLTPKLHVWILALKIVPLKVNNYKCRFQTLWNWSTERNSWTWQCFAVIIYIQAQFSFQWGSNLAAITANSEQTMSFHKGYKSLFTRT